MFNMEKRYRNKIIIIITIIIIIIIIIIKKETEAHKFNQRKANTRERNNSKQRN